MTIGKATSPTNTLRRFRMTSTLDIELTFDDFGWRSLEERASADRLTLTQLLSLACSYHESQLADDRPATSVPRFRRRPVEGETRALGIEFNEQSLQRLQAEAERQGVSLERLCEHAALLYLADLDAGRVAEQIARETSN
jgi:hypothetical protein